MLYLSQSLTFPRSALFLTLLRNHLKHPLHLSFAHWVAGVADPHFSGPQAKFQELQAAFRAFGDL